MKYKYSLVGNRITVGPFRFTVFSATNIRCEASLHGFEDRPSQLFLHRPNNFRLFCVNPDTKSERELKTGVATEKSVIDGEHESELSPFTISTSEFELQFLYEENVTVAFTNANLVIFNTSWQTKWKFSAKEDIDELNLLGTTCTLDYQRETGKLIIEHGLLSRLGFTVIDDSHSLVFNEQKWLIPRSDVVPTVAKIGLKEAALGASRDFYYFCYGDNYQQCLTEFAALTGPVPLVPKWSLGLWWSKWHPYSQQDIIELVDTFKQQKIPLSALCIDMDWHLVDVRKELGGPSGWTGYTWNKKLIESPPKLLNDLHQRGVRVALNLHPAEGCYPHEEAYKDFAQFMGIDPAENKQICFDIGDPKFAEGYFKFLHHPHEAIGVDMWWIDWQQEDTTSVPSLTPLWWLNHLHHENALRKDVRPLTFSRWGGFGNHRYPLGFSGDTVADWSTLQMLPYITSTAANVCYNWWSHDIGGHMWGTNDPDLYIRWFQFGVLSPILRLHSTNNPFDERLPWKYDKATFAIVKEAFRFRESLIPYIYSIAWKMSTHKNASLVFPTYYKAPTSENAYNCPHQYFFGEGLLVVPFLSKADPETRLSRTVAWFPPGSWIGFESGREYPRKVYQNKNEIYIIRYLGNKYQAIYGKLDEIPIFAQPGAIVPLLLHKKLHPPHDPALLKFNIPLQNFNMPMLNIKNIPLNTETEIFEIRIFAGANGEFELYDDDGVSLDQQPNTTRLIKFTQKHANEGANVNTTLTITNEGHPQALVYCLRFFGIFTQPLDIELGESQHVLSNYASASHQLVIQPIYDDLTQPVVFEITHPKETSKQADTRRSQQQTEYLISAINSFATFAPIKDSIGHTVRRRDDFEWMFTNGFDDKTSAYKIHIEIAAECGSACFETPENTYVVLWNYNKSGHVFYECKSTDNKFNCEPTNIPEEKILVFSREFKLKQNCVVTVSMGKKWQDTYTVGAKITTTPQKPDKRRSFLQNFKKIF